MPNFTESDKSNGELCAIPSGQWQKEGIVLLELEGQKGTYHGH